MTGSKTIQEFLGNLSGAEVELAQSELLRIARRDAAKAVWKDQTQMRQELNRIRAEAAAAKKMKDVDFAVAYRANIIERLVEAVMDGHDGDLRPLAAIQFPKEGE